MAPSARAVDHEDLPALGDQLSDRSHLVLQIYECALAAERLLHEGYERLVLLHGDVVLERLDGLAVQKHSLRRVLVQELPHFVKEVCQRPAREVPVAEPIPPLVVLSRTVIDSDSQIKVPAALAQQLPGTVALRSAPGHDHAAAQGQEAAGRLPVGTRGATIEILSARVVRARHDEVWHRHVAEGSHPVCCVDRRILGTRLHLHVPAGDLRIPVAHRPAGARWAPPPRKGSPSLQRSGGNPKAGGWP
mmetsp:Transcript_61702/g.183831  ORF Transcript_61702/g.183831 Transcript_61702/m.183831 type:complete len:247 (+) Transcript_61702:422-1162(+)